MQVLLIFGLLISFTYAHALIDAIPLTDGLTLTIRKLSSGYEFTVQRDLTIDDGWFAIGFGDNPSMIGIRKFYNVAVNISTISMIVTNG